MAPTGTPEARARAAAASTFATSAVRRGPRGASSSRVAELERGGAAVVEEGAVARGCPRRRRSRSGPGMPRPKPIARAPSCTSASSTMCGSRRRRGCRRRRPACWRRRVAFAARYASAEPCQSRWSSAMLRHDAGERMQRAGARRGQVVELVARELDDEHVEAAGSRIASSTGTPMLPHGAARRPPAASIVAVSCVVVVLPFVPVTRIQSAGVVRHLVAHAPGELDVAPDGDPVLGRPVEHADGRGGSPGETTTSSGANAASSSGTELESDAATSRAPITSSRRARSSSAAGATTSTSAPELGRACRRRRTR